MLVRDLMSWPVITVYDNTTVGEALEILNRNNIRHLPVVELNQTLVGVVSETDLVKVFPSGNRLNTFESNLLARTPVLKVMKPRPVSIAPGKTLEEAALIMRTKHISCLPVLDEKQKMVGLISKNDIIDAFIVALGLGVGGTRITMIYKKKWGFLSELISFADERNITIENMVTFDNELVIKVNGKADTFVHDLQNAGYKITNISYIEPPTVNSPANGQ